MFEQVFVVMAVAIIAVVLTTVVAVTVVAVRRVRRASGAARRRVGAALASGRGLGPRRSSQPGAAPVGVSAFAADARATVGSPGWWMLQRDRRHVWRTVAGRCQIFCVSGLQ